MHHFQCKILVFQTFKIFEIDFFSPDFIGQSAVRIFHDQNVLSDVWTGCFARGLFVREGLTQSLQFLLKLVKKMSRKSFLSIQNDPF